MKSAYDFDSDYDYYDYLASLTGERREVMQRWCDYVEVCMKGGADLLL